MGDKFENREQELQNNFESDTEKDLQHPENKELTELQHDVLREQQDKELVETEKMENDEKAEIIKDTKEKVGTLKKGVNTNKQPYAPAQRKTPDQMNEEEIYQNAQQGRKQSEKRVTDLISSQSRLSKRFSD